MDRGKLLFRPIKEDDLVAILEIATKVGPGFTSLPNEQKFIQKRIDNSINSFKGESTEDEQSFFFVLEDLSTNTIVGTAAIEVCISSNSPYYSYEVATLVQKHKPQNKEINHTLLSLENNYQNASVLCTLYLNSKYRGMKRGEFLSRARCLFIAEFPDLFSDTIVAELRGYFDENGISPFWEALGRHFFEADFQTINNITTKEGTQIVSDLMPKYPIYACLLSEEAQEAIGKTHPDTQAAKHVLEKEGFTYRHYVDILDAGPVIEVEKKNLKTLLQSRRCKVFALKPVLEGKVSMISNTDMDFKATMGIVEIYDETQVILEQAVADSLSLKVGDWIRFSSLE